MTPKHVSRAAHAAMVVGMAVMAASGEAVAGGPQSGQFTATALWFALRAVAVPAGRLANLHHAVLGGAMTWMTALPRHHGHPGGPAGQILVGYCAAATGLWLVAALRRHLRSGVAHGGPAGAPGTLTRVRGTGRSGASSAVGHAVMAAAMGVMLAGG